MVQDRGLPKCARAQLSWDRFGHDLGDRSARHTGTQASNTGDVARGVIGLPLTRKVDSELTSLSQSRSSGHLIMIVRFDATIDDVVDVNMRSWANSKTMRLWRWQGAAVTGLMFAVPAYFLFGETAGARLVIAGAAALIGVGYYLWT